MFTVTTTSGFKMILEDAGRDNAGNQLWRQVNVGLGQVEEKHSSYYSGPAHRGPREDCRICPPLDDLVPRSRNDRIH